MPKEKLNPTEETVKDESPKITKIKKIKTKLTRKRGSSLLKAVILILVLVLAFGLIGRGNKVTQLWAYLTGKSPKTAQLNDLGITSQKSSLQVPEGAIAEEAAVEQVADQSSKAVVSIIITKDVPKIQNNFFDPFGSGNQDPSSLFEQFFGQQQPQQPQQQPGGGGTVKQEIGGGSGFVVSEDGLIVTNKHVVADPNADYTVLTNEGREYSAKVLGRDRINDVAVIKIDPTKPTKGDGVDKMDTLPLGDSSQIKVGQTVVAIGNALGEFTNTVSKGIVSGLRRNIVAGGGMGGSEQLDQLIQTDAAINEGNSGGPLLNLKGEVIGINVAIAQGAQNIGFALPIDTVKNTIQSVQQTGKISQPYLGVRYQIINQAIKDKNNLPFDYGALVLRGQDPTDLAVIPGSPADKAGIQENDIILEANGTKIEDKNPLTKIIAGLQVGTNVELKVWHKGNVNTVKVDLVEAPSSVQ